VQGAAHQVFIDFKKAYDSVSIGIAQHCHGIAVKLVKPKCDNVH
jgi:hypothetical protein